MRPVHASSAVDRGDRSAVMVEFVIVAPLLVLLVFGLLEFGLAWRDAQTVATAARSGARVGSNLGPERETDYNVLLSVLAASQAVGVDDINYVVIYSASDPDGKIPSQCITPGGFQSFANLCNVYDTAQLLAISPADFQSNAAGTACKGDALDRFWCPLSRVATSQYTLGYFGIYVEVEHRATAGILPIANLTIEDSAVMRIEPAGAS